MFTSCPMRKRGRDTIEELEHSDLETDGSDKVTG